MKLLHSPQKYLRAHAIFCAINIFFFATSLSYAAEFDDIYGPLLKENNLLVTTEADFFQLFEYGHHGTTGFDRFTSRPSFYKMNTNIRFPLTAYGEARIDYNEAIPTRYDRLTNTESDTLYAKQHYHFTHFREFAIGLRTRYKECEPYFSFMRRQHKESRNFALANADPTVFNYMRYYFTNFDTGIRFVLNEKDNENEKAHTPALALIKKQMLAKGQLKAEVDIEYNEGAMRRNDEYTSGRFNNYYQTLHPHVTPKISIGYGLTPSLEIESGVSYTTPFKLDYVYNRYNADTSYTKTIGNYNLTNVIQIPLSLAWQPSNSFLVSLSSDSEIAQQKLTYYTDDNGSTTSYPTRKLLTYTTRPKAEATYFYDNGKELKKTPFSSLTKQLLKQNQLMLSLSYQRDITHLHKGANNGALNRIDPYNLFTYPLDDFISGSEYATFLTGNSSTSSANVLPQNYDVLEGSIMYGLLDAITVGGKIGYNSGSHFHHFLLNETQDRYYILDHYLYIDSSLDWHITQRSLFSIAAHFVPEYTTYLKRENEDKRFTSQNKYFSIVAKFQILF